jgi:hypothetical protein
MGDSEVSSIQSSVVTNGHFHTYSTSLPKGEEAIVESLGENQDLKRGR